MRFWKPGLAVWSKGWETSRVCWRLARIEGHVPTYGRSGPRRTCTSESTQALCFFILDVPTNQERRMLGKLIPFWLVSIGRGFQAKRKRNASETWKLIHGKHETLGKVLSPSWALLILGLHSHLLVLHPLGWTWKLKKPGDSRQQAPCAGLAVL